MYDVNLINKLIRHRRSIFPRDYSGEKVDDAIVQQILENATWAPTHKMTQPWRFMIFTGDGLKKLAEFQGACYKEVATAKGKFEQDKYEGLLTKPMQSSHIISIGMKRDEKKSIPELEEIGAIYCAVENMYLTATAYGLGAYLSTGGITFYEEAKPFFNLGAEDKLLGFFHVGNTTYSPPDNKRRPVEALSVWVR
ncbi:MAG TPA: nitroreductase [Cyclobacteriaceae bacterium]|nr:nitroreductase [Cyclobacteriaceae bacterium]